MESKTQLVIDPVYEYYDFTAAANFAKRNNLLDKTKYPKLSAYYMVANGEQNKPSYFSSPSEFDKFYNLVSSSLSPGHAAGIFLTQLTKLYPNWCNVHVMKADQFSKFTNMLQKLDEFQKVATGFQLSVKEISSQIDNFILTLFTTSNPIQTHTPFKGYVSVPQEHFKSSNPPFSLQFYEISGQKQVIPCCVTRDLEYSYEFWITPSLPGRGRIVVMFGTESKEYGIDIEKGIDIERAPMTQKPTGYNNNNLKVLSANDLNVQITTEILQKNSLITGKIILPSYFHETPKQDPFKAFVYFNNQENKIPITCRASGGNLYYFDFRPMCHGKGFLLLEALDGSKKEFPLNIEKAPLGPQDITLNLITQFPCIDRPVEATIHVPPEHYNPSRIPFTVVFTYYGKDFPVTCVPGESNNCYRISFVSKSKINGKFNVRVGNSILAASQEIDIQGKQSLSDIDLNLQLPPTCTLGNSISVEVTVPHKDYSDFSQYPIPFSAKFQQSDQTTIDAKCELKTGNSFSINFFPTVAGKGTLVVTLLATKTIKSQPLNITKVHNLVVSLEGVNPKLMENFGNDLGKKLSMFGVQLKVVFGEENAHIIFLCNKAVQQAKFDDSARILVQQCPKSKYSSAILIQLVPGLHKTKFGFWKAIPTSSDTPDSLNLTFYPSGVFLNDASKRHLKVSWLSFLNDHLDDDNDEELTSLAHFLKEFCDKC